MLPFQIGRHQGAEREDHCRRVAVLASRTSALLPLGTATRADLVAAAKLHHQWSVFHAAAAGSGGKAAAILDRLYREGQSPSDDLGLAARILEVCDAFDEAMEFAAFEGNSLAVAADTFYRETAGQFDRKVVDALRRVTGGEEHRPASPLPVMPRKAAALLRTSDETASPVELAAIAAGDPVLSGRLIGVANSGRYGSRHTITGLNEAALRVGAPVARKVLLAACIGGLFASKPLQKLWLHCQEVAAAAFEIATACGIDGNTAWLAGLLHDIGRLVLMSCPGAPAVNLIELTGGGFPLVYAEMLTFGKDHAATGAALLRGWNVPGEIADAVEVHHEPEHTEDALPSVLFLAEQLNTSEDTECLSAKLRFAIACRNTGLTPAVLNGIQEEALVAAS
jgi:putative nucleotidyltransferase with HDIG domain